MAQLRCAQTSDLLAEGTPLEIATAAETFGAGEVLFDDVGADPTTGKARFDPAAVRGQREVELSGLEATLAAMPTRPPEGETPEAFAQRRDTLKATIAERHARFDAGRDLAKTARTRRDEALARVEDRRARDARPDPPRRPR